MSATLTPSPADLLASRRLQAELEHLRDELGLDSGTSAVHVAIAVLRETAALEERGGTVILREPDGREHPLRVSARLPITRTVSRTPMYKTTL